VSQGDAGGTVESRSLIVSPAGILVFTIGGSTESIEQIGVIARLLGRGR
jgi:hypothetical protein